MGVLAEKVEDEGHPEPDFPDRDPSPYDILREATEAAVADLNTAVAWGTQYHAAKSVARDLERAMYLAAGGAE